MIHSTPTGMHMVLPDNRGGWGRGWYMVGLHGDCIMPLHSSYTVAMATNSQHQ